MGDLREQLKWIEYRITQGMTAHQCFTLMKQLLTADDGRTARAAVPEGWREFVEGCAQAAGGEVCGNALSRRAAALLAAAPQPAGKTTTDDIDGGLVGDMLTMARDLYGDDFGRQPAPSPPSPGNSLSLDGAAGRSASLATAEMPADLAAAVADDDAAWRLARLSVQCGAEDNATDGQPQTWTLGVGAFTELACRLPERIAMSRMKDAAMEAHRLCYEAMQRHPEVATLGDDGELHKAIHAIVAVDTPSYVPPDGSSKVPNGGEVEP